MSRWAFRFKAAQCFDSGSCPDVYSRWLQSRALHLAPNTSNLIALAKLYMVSPEKLLECTTGTLEGESATE